MDQSAKQDKPEFTIAASVGPLIMFRIKLFWMEEPFTVLNIFASSMLKFFILYKGAFASKLRW